MRQLRGGDPSDAFYRYRDLPGDSWDLRGLVAHEQLQQVREVDGEAAYQEQKRIREDAWERARNPRMPSRRPLHDRPQQPDPRGPERDSGPSR